MTVMLIRQLAKEMAGQMFEQATVGGVDPFATTPEERERSAKFRHAYPTLKDFMKGFQRQPYGFVPPMGPDGHPLEKKYFRVDGSDCWWMLDRPGWNYHVEHARSFFAMALRPENTTYTQHEKNVIADALIEENNRATAPHAQKLLARRLAGKAQIN